ncbi:MAG: hypothetical protein O7F70_04995 [Gemmatimonadetes bacterium]|nr:hypothetical protein [Gemmatimonadota bacterium]
MNKLGPRKRGRTIVACGETIGIAVPSSSRQDLPHMTSGLVTDSVLDAVTVQISAGGGEERLEPMALHGARNDADSRVGWFALK